MTLGSPIVVTCSLEVFHGLFTLASTVHLDSTLNAKILNALYDYQPSINDAQATLAWLTVMQEAYRALGRLDYTYVIKSKILLSLHIGFSIIIYRKLLHS